MKYLSLQDIQADLASKTLRLTDLVSSYLKNIEENKELNAFLEVFSEEAIQRATALENEVVSGKKAGKLYGMIIGIKDNICYRNHKVSAGSHILENFTSIYNATVVERLLAEDAIIIGRLNCDEFAMGSSNENSAYGTVKNPLDHTRVPGGSSGGSAAAVAANLCLATLGSDTGGSIRQPASFCGVVGLKPTYGRVSRHGLVAYASSFDQIGPLTHTVEDAAKILEVIAGKDGFDATASSKEVAHYSDFSSENKSYKIAYFPQILHHEGLDSKIREASEKLLDELKAAGHELVPVDFNLLDYLISTYYVITTAEASSNLARYDGVHFGFRAQNADSLEDVYVKTRTEGFGKEVKKRIMLGTFVLSSGYYDAYYTKAQKVRRILRDEMQKVFEKADFFFTPTTPSEAFKLGEKTNDPLAMYLADIYTVLANLVGMPAISLPLLKGSEGLPVGAQFMSAAFEEKKLCAFSHQLMKQHATAGV